MPVQAKFRCLGINHRWNCHHMVDLAPVYDQEFPENKTFWEATPSGEAKVETGPECPFKVGAFYLVDFDEVAERPKDQTQWGHYYRLDHTSDRGASLDVVLVSGWGTSNDGLRTAIDGVRQGTVKMSICNRSAWPHFTGKVDGPWWRVTYTETSKEG